MTREQDALFAEKVAGWTDVHLRKSYVSNVYDLWCGNPRWAKPHDDKRIVSFYSEGTNLIFEMMEAIEKLCGTLSRVILWLEDGTYCAMASWFDEKWHDLKNYGDGTANGALLALGLALADEVQNTHGEETP